MQQQQQQASYHDVMVTCDEEDALTTPLGPQTQRDRQGDKKGGSGSRSRSRDRDSDRPGSYQINHSRLSEQDLAAAVAGGGGVGVTRTRTSTGTALDSFLDSLDRFFVMDEDDEHRCSYGMLIVALSGLCNGLGNSMVSNSILSLLHTFFLLVGVDWIFRDDVKLFTWLGLRLILCILVIQGFGFCLGFYSMFGYPHDTVVTVLEAFGAGVLAWIIYVIVALIPHLMYLELFPESFSGIWVYPTLQTVASCSIIGSVFSVFITPGNSALDYEPLKQLASLLGIAAVNFVFVFCGSYPAFLVTRHREFSRTTLRKTTLLMFIGLLVTFCITAFINRSPYLLQKNISEIIEPVVPVSCIFAQNAEVGSDTWYQLWNSTESRIIAGDAIVLMSEESMLIKSEADEQMIIDKAMTMAQQSTAEKGVLVGLLYMLQLHGSNGMSKNRFVLIGYDAVNAPSSEVLWTYDKAHPVPLVEINIEPGHEKLPFSQTNYGYASGAICFDLDFPQYIAQAGREQVDIFLQPSWTWNAINFRHFEGDAVRAVENGFTMFRCSSNGESGVVNPQGKFLHRQETGHDPNVMALFSMPIRSHANPMFPFLGFIFEYICIAWGIYYVFYCFMGFRHYCRGVSYNVTM